MFYLRFLQFQIVLVIPWLKLLSYSTKAEINPFSNGLGSISAKKYTFLNNLTCKKHKSRW
jgi:hypothetical protein